MNRTGWRSGTVKKVDEWQFQDSLGQFLDVRSENPYPYSFGSDLCSPPPTVFGDAAYLLIPYDERFGNACKRHDFGYQNYGRRLKIEQVESIRQAIDDQFLEDMRSICEQSFNVSDCRAAALIFHEAVRLGARNGFERDEEFVWDASPENAEEP